MRYFASTVALVLCVVSGYAQNTPKDSVEHVTLDTMEVKAPAGATPYQPSATRAWDIKNTRIALTFNWKEKTAEAREWIKLHPYCFTTDTLELDAKGMRIDSVVLVGKKGYTRLDYTYNNDKLKIHFDRVYKMQDSIELYLRYTAMPYSEATGGSKSISDDRGLYFINTDYAIPHKPAMIWTQGETEANSHWMVTIDKPNTRFTTQVELTVPDEFATLSNGALIKQTGSRNNSHTDIWRMDMPIQAYAVMFAIGKYSIVKQQWRGKEVSYYVEPEYEQFARLMFAHTPEMMEYFSQRTGVPYPWNKYSQVVVRDYVSGAMENTSATLLGEFMNQNARELADRNSEDVVSHELFHQWFGDYVTSESWSNITVNESFANYGEQLWKTFRYGKAIGDELAYNDLHIYLSTAPYNGDPQLVRFNYDSREDVFDPISYNKGGATLRYLNNLIGDTAFDRVMNYYLTKNALHSAEAHNWRLAVEEVTGQDWNWFFNEWYYHAGHPVLKVDYKYDDELQKLTVTVRQTQSDSPFLYRLPLKAAVIYGDNKTIVDWNITKRKEVFTYSYKNGQKPVIVPDCEHVLPGEIKDGKKMPQWLEQYKQCDDFVSKRQAVAAAGKLMSDSISLIIIDQALTDPIASVKRLALTQLKSSTSERYQRKFTKYIVYMAGSDSSKLVRAEAFNVLGEWKVASAKGNMVQALNYSSYLIGGAALEALNKIDPDTAYIVAKQMLGNDPRSVLETTIWSIIGKKGSDEDIAQYERKGPYVFNSKKFSFATSIGNYMKNVKSDNAFRRALEVYMALITTEDMKKYRAYLTESLFTLAGDIKTKTKSDKPDEAEIAQKRLEILKGGLSKIVAAEKDADNNKENEKKMKEIFE